MKRLSLMLVPFAFAATMSIAVTTAAAQTPQYLSPSETGPHGSAPKMQVKQLSHGSGSIDYAVVFGEGDDPFAGMTKFAAEHHVHSGHFTAIGAFQNARLAYFDYDRKMYRVIPIDSQVEVVSLIGDIAELNGKPSVHMHCVVAFPDGHTMGGHVLSAHVRPLLEVFVTTDPVAIEKKHDDKTGLSVMDLGAKSQEPKN